MKFEKKLLKECEAIMIGAIKSEKEERKKDALECYIRVCETSLIIIKNIKNVIYKTSAQKYLNLCLSRILYLKEELKDSIPELKQKFDKICDTVRSQSPIDSKLLFQAKNEAVAAVNYENNGKYLLAIQKYESAVEMFNSLINSCKSFKLGWYRKQFKKVVEKYQNRIIQLKEKIEDM